MSTQAVQRPVHVVVLAAGRGSRMGPLGDDIPKWLLRVGERTIAEHQLEGIMLAREEAPSSIASVQVVTGHAADAIDDFLSKRPEHEATGLYNVDYARLNNWFSVLVALRALDDADGAVVIMNSDLFARADWFARFLIDSTRTSSESLIGVDLVRRLTDESMKVSVNRGSSDTLSEVGKSGIEDPVGEYVGLLMARGGVLEAFRKTLEGFVGRAESDNEWYERAVGLTAAQGTPWKIWPTPDSGWVEIDDDGDYATALQIAEEH